MKLLKNIKQLVTLESASKKDGRFLKPEDLSIKENVSLIFNEREILWIGESIKIPSSLKIEKEFDCSNLVVTPEIVDCHTHLVFGGNRSKEYSMRLNGADYQEIANAGGGILSTMKATNESSRDDLFMTACERIERIASYGVGSIEIKSGYGLNYDKEYELSHIINDLKKAYFPKIQIKNTFLAAHAIPKNFGSSEQYLNEVVIPLLEKLSEEKIIDAVDIFHEEGYFNTDDTIMLFKKARELGLPVKSHADEFVDNKGALLACTYDALSTDHLLMTGEDGIEKLGKSKTVATLLPGTGFFLGKDQAKARKFLDAGAKVAIGSDYNPGSCHFDNVLYSAAIAAPHYKMNICELWASITLNAADAIGLEEQGSILVKKRPRFSFFNVESIDEITYNWGRNFAISLEEN